eukprot:9658691-Prorocentrum_lima.AAC.1
MFGQTPEAKLRNANLNKSQLLCLKLGGLPDSLKAMSRTDACLMDRSNSKSSAAFCCRAATSP